MVVRFQSYCIFIRRDSAPEIGYLEKHHPLVDSVIVAAHILCDFLFLFCDVILIVLSGFAIILLRKKDS